MLSDTQLLALHTVYAKDDTFATFVSQLDKYQQEIDANGDTDRAKDLEESILWNFARNQKDIGARITESKTTIKHYYDIIAREQQNLDKLNELQGTFDNAAVAVLK